MRRFDRFRDIRRGKGKIEPRPRILIVCEGSKTEPLYFKDLMNRHRNKLVDLEIIPAGGTPKTIVEKAVALKKREAARAKRDSVLPYDEVWCVFDIDEHPFVEEAKEQAKANKISVAISNPSFELWVLLHYQMQTAFLSRQDALKRCCQLIPEYAKGTPPVTALREKYDDAVRNCKSLDKWQAEQGRSPFSNPSTGVYILTERIELLSSTGRMAALEKSPVQWG